MQNKLNKDLKNKPLNIKYGLKKDLMNMAKSWSIAFSNKHKHEINKEFTAWLEK